MSEAFRHFVFAELSEGQWLGEESLVNHNSKLQYTVRAKTNLVAMKIAL